MEGFITGLVLFGLFVDYFWVYKNQSNFPKKWPKFRNPFYVE